MKGFAGAIRHKLEFFKDNVVVSLASEAVVGGFDVRIKIRFDSIDYILQVISGVYVVAAEGCEGAGYNNLAAARTHIHTNQAGSAGETGVLKVRLAGLGVNFDFVTENCS